jgi:peroxiredoxin
VDVDARAFGHLSVLDSDGRQVQLDSLWQDRPAVIVWLRHFGCLFCREQAREFRAARRRIEAAGARLVFIGNGGVQHLQEFEREEAPDVTVLTDPGVRTYSAIGARSGAFSTVGPRTWVAGLRALRRGARQSAVRGRPFQQGGVLVVLPGGTVAFTHLSASAGDHPDIEAVLAALPARTVAAS